MNLSKVSLILSIIGFITTAVLKDWVPMLLWFVVITQDLKILSLEGELEEIK